MGDKDEAKRTMKAAGVPVIPGSADVISDIGEGLKEAEKIGYPVLIKARSGGGGRGIRRIDCPEDFNKVFEAAQIEAKNSFGDSALYVEKFLKPVKHVEVQVLCDNTAMLWCLESGTAQFREKPETHRRISCFTLSESIRQKLYEPL
jgi:acetyl-CoA carboxylase biotin carboxylase subunit